MNSLLLADIESMKVSQTSFDQIDNDWLELVASNCMQMMQTMQEFDVRIKRDHIKRLIFILSLHSSLLSPRRKLNQQISTSSRIWPIKALNFKKSAGRMLTFFKE